MSSSQSDDYDILTLIMKPNNPVNTTLATEDGKVYYTAFTEHGKTTRTEVRNATEEIIAVLDWRDVLPDKVTFGHHKTCSIWDWMKKSHIPLKKYAKVPLMRLYDRILTSLYSDLTFHDEQGRRYTWKGNTVGQSFEVSQWHHLVYYSMLIAIL